MRRYQQLVRLGALTVAAGLVLVLTAYKAEQNAARRARFRERDLRWEAANDLGQEVLKRIQMALEAGLTFPEFARAFGAPAELSGAADPGNTGMTHSVFHKKSRQTFYLRFRDGRLEGFSSGHVTGPVGAKIVLETPAFRRSESVRTAVLSGGLLAWCVVLVAGIYFRRFRRRAATWLVTASLVCGLCWFLAPNYTPTWSGVWSNDGLALFVFLLIASLGFGVAAPRDEDAHRRDELHAKRPPTPSDSPPNTT
jgi:hypothetical protein